MRAGIFVAVTPATVFLLGACQSHARGRTTAEQTGEAAGDIVSLEVFVSGMTCPRLNRASLALRVTDLTDASIVAEGLSLKSDWKAVGEVRMLRGPHELALVEVTKNRVLAQRNASFDGGGSWRLALEVPCEGRSVSFVPVASL